ncbi:hypothetical protein OFN34_36915, partial [Escherichia coli]|nr:hypothetical protein [Escherichia coli]
TVTSVSTMHMWPTTCGYVVIFGQKIDLNIDTSIWERKHKWRLVVVTETFDTARRANTCWAVPHEVIVPVVF